MKCAAYLLLKMAFVRYIFPSYQSPPSELEKIYLKVQKHKHKQKWKNNEHKDKTQNLSWSKGCLLMAYSAFDDFKTNNIPKSNFWDEYWIQMNSFYENFNARIAKFVTIYTILIRSFCRPLGIAPITRILIQNAAQLAKHHKNNLILLYLWHYWDIHKKKIHIINIFIIQVLHLDLHP